MVLQPVTPSTSARGGEEMKGVLVQEDNKRPAQEKVNVGTSYRHRL